MEPIVSTSSGLIQGSSIEATHVFLGVPYAAPPIGEHRLGAPVSPARWDGIRPATDYGPTAPQPDQGVTIIPEPVIAGDDWLNLNIFTPDLGSARLPVLVWIHGGGFVAGSSASPWYRGERFARRGVVTVSFNYRLGAEGFAALDGAPANRGLRDGLAALDWVQDNIEAFGGDPARVTLAGQSAGASACCALLSSPMARGRFGRVIAMSGSAALVSRADQAQRRAERLGARLGVAATRHAFADVDPTALVAAQQAVSSGDDGADGSPPGLSFVPFVDGEVIPEDPLVATAAGVGGDVELLIGSTSQEFNFVSRAAGGDFPPERVARRLEKLGVDPSRLAGYLAAHAGAEPIEIAAQAATDAMFRVNVARVAEARAAAAGSASTYTYEFRWPSPVGDFGSAHCLDIPFAFDLLDAKGVSAVIGDDPPQVLADEMHAAWAAFITDGRPGWPAYDRATRTTQVFDAPSEVTHDLHAELRAAWNVS